ncbi:efflux transporter outer membrane subunit [Caulobacter soli]|uniref:efflux transporter outer membrane subunit n=1 Tax=Caulobacter soli TaxID=2708539 RepID=UPI0013EABA0D|nr:TolC family protein [Caulobacter soli]
MTGERQRPRPFRSGASILALSLAGLALAGCVHTPRPTPDTRLPAAYAAPAGAALPQATLDRWWTSFNDPQLTALIETALEKAPDARTATAKLEEARAVRKGQVRQLYIPSTPLTGKASKTHTDILDSKGASFTQGGDSESYGANFDVSWELDLWGRRRAARQVVDNDLAAARFNYEGARAALAASVAQSYFDARGLAVQLDDAQETARINGELREFSTKKAKAGLIASSEADRAAADEAQSLAQVENLQGQLTAARRTLLILVGRGIDPVASLPVDATLDAAPPIPATLPDALLARRPDIREAQARLASAAGNLKINELALLPTLNLTPGVGWSKSVSPAFPFITESGATTGGKTSTTSSAWTLGANISIPVLNIPSLLADIDAQNARTQQAAIAYEKAVQTAYGEAENAMVQLAADQRRVALLTDGEARAQRAYAAGRKGYTLGLTDLTSTLQSEMTWRASRTALTGAKTQALQRAVQAYKALGGGWAPDALVPQDQTQQVSSK